jgi:hypothetical protein
MLAENNLHNLRASSHSPRTIITTTHTSHPLPDRNTTMAPAPTPLHPDRIELRDPRSIAAKYRKLANVWAHAIHEQDGELRFAQLLMDLVEDNDRVLAWERDVEVTLANGEIVDAVLYWEDGIGYDISTDANDAEILAMTQDELYELDEATR